MDRLSHMVLGFCIVASLDISTLSYEYSTVSPKDDAPMQRQTMRPMRESCINQSNIPSIRVNTSEQLRRLRLNMKGVGYDAYIVPASDEHQSGFVSDHDKRRQFISGFSGSAGTAVVLQDSAALWTDGRYILQAEDELDCNWLLMKMDPRKNPPLDDWIIHNLKPNSVVGADSKLIPYRKWMLLMSKFTKFNLTLSADASNLIDDIWRIPQGRVPESVSHVFIHDVKYAGKTWQTKVAEIRESVNKSMADGLIVSALDEIAWLFNLRDKSAGYTPVFKSYAFVTEAAIKLYVKKLKITSDVEKYLCPNDDEKAECVEVVDYHKAFEDMRKEIELAEKILVSSSSSYAIINLVPESKRILLEEPSPVAKLKVVKNAVEISGMKNAALRDSVAIVDFISKFEDEVKSGKHWDELKVSRALTKYRKEQELNQGESFETISAFGANAAVIHYRPEISTNRNINTKHLFLLDTGGQYLDGTTDITRTFHFGEPTEFEVEAYTRVLMGAIDSMSAVFPDGTSGSKIDILARRHLYAAGLDYHHGTSHGIGSYLSVHEGPISFGSFHTQPNYPLKPGMFLSDEPGFYADKKFGIRLENMMMVVKAYTPHHFDNSDYFTFEPVSFVPFEPKLIDLHLLTKKQKEWLNWFNMKSRNSVGLELRKQHRTRGFSWLMSKTEYIPVENCDYIVSSAFCSYSNVGMLMFILMLVYI